MADVDGADKILYDKTQSIDDVPNDEPLFELKPDPLSATREGDLNDDNAQETHVTIQLPDGMQGTTLSQERLQELILQLSQSGQIELREDSKIVIDLKFSGKGDDSVEEKNDNQNIAPICIATSQTPVNVGAQTPRLPTTPSIKSDARTPILRAQPQQQPTYILLPTGQLPGSSSNQFQQSSPIRPSGAFVRTVTTSGAGTGTVFNSSDRNFVVLQQPLSGPGMTQANAVPVIVSNTNTSNAFPVRQITSGVSRVAANTTWVAAGPNRLTTQRGGSDVFINSLNVLTRGHATTRESPRESSWQQYVKQFTKLGPCPICGDKISGYHYGIFCCESCKGFFKRTVQNAKRYACHHPNTNSVCEVTIASRKKCPACRFIKCVEKGMRIEAIRSDRTRGGRSMYPGSRYLRQIASRVNSARSGGLDTMGVETELGRSSIMDQDPLVLLGLSAHHSLGPDGLPSSMDAGGGVFLDPAVLGSAIDEEDESDPRAIRVNPSQYPNSTAATSSNMPYMGRQVILTGLPDGVSRPQVEWSKELTDLFTVEESIEAEPEDVLEIDPDGPPAGLSVPEGVSEDEAAVYRALLKLTDQRLYRTVRWSRALPEFAQLDTDDQILLLQNCWTDLLCLDCCWRSLPTPKEIRLTSTKCINLEAARELGAEDVVERMLRLTHFLTELPLDVVEYSSLKAIILMHSDLKNLKAATHVQEYQQSIHRSLQEYITKVYPNKMDKYSKLLSCIPDLHSVSQTARLMLVDLDLSPYLSANSLLMELLRSDIQRFAPSATAVNNLINSETNDTRTETGEATAKSSKLPENSNFEEPMVEEPLGEEAGIACAEFANDELTNEVATVGTE